MIKFLISIFDIFVRNRFFLDILPNFNLSRTLQRAFFGPLYFREFISAAMFQFFVENCSKCRHIVKNITWIEIIITISINLP